MDIDALPLEYKLKYGTAVRELSLVDIIGSVTARMLGFDVKEADEIRELRSIVEEVMAPDCHEWTST